MKRRKRKIILLSLAALIVLAVIACAAYVSDYYHADEAAVEAMSISDTIRIEQTENALAFIPEDAAAGFIFYPGGKVEYTAYAPLMRALAENDILCVLVEMPFNLAVLDMNAADGIPERYPQIESWYIGGHSLGGSMAASHAADNPDDYDGLVLLAAYSTADLKESGIEVISIYGSEDGVLNREKYEQYRSNLPDGFTEHIIDGGNHAGFGSYGTQDGDGTAAITNEEQIAETAELILNLIH